MFTKWAGVMTQSVLARHLAEDSKSFPSGGLIKNLIKLPAKIDDYILIFFLRTL